MIELMNDENLRLGNLSCRGLPVCTRRGRVVRTNESALQHLGLRPRNGRALPSGRAGRQSARGGGEALTSSSLPSSRITKPGSGLSPPADASVPAPVDEPGRVKRTLRMFLSNTTTRPGSSRRPGSRPACA